MKARGRIRIHIEKCESKARHKNTRRTSQEDLEVAKVGFIN